jgi:hypothetical protein
MMINQVVRLHAKTNKLSLLPNRSIAVESLTLKEAVMRHADPKHQDDGEKKRHEDDRRDLK